MDKTDFIDLIETNTRYKIEINQQETFEFIGLNSFK